MPTTCRPEVSRRAGSRPIGLLIRAAVAISYGGPWACPPPFGEGAGKEAVSSIRLSTAASLADLIMFVLVDGVAGCGDGTIGHGLGDVDATTPSAGNGLQFADIG
jgi:hypothetical protein